MARAEEELRVEVVYCAGPHAVDAVQMLLPAGSTAGQALLHSGLCARHGLVAAEVVVGLWGRTCAPAQELRDRDRVEVYRPLQVDPKEARRLRYKSRKAATRTPPASPAATG